MGLDRRILSILYYNDIVDVNDVEEFIGEENGYYIVKVSGENKKLKVPGVDYPEEEVEEIFAEFDLEEIFIDEPVEPIEPIENDTFVQKTTEESLLEAENESKKSLLSVKTEVIITETEVDPIEPDTVNEPVNEPVKPVKEKKKPKAKSKAKPKKKTTKITTKKIDDDFDDFIKTV